ncbi:adenylate/guanylate cyclase domain-containing protein [Amorphus sp. MBR-141]
MTTAADGLAARALKAAEDSGLKIALRGQMAAALLAAGWLVAAYPVDVLSIPLASALVVLVIGAVLHQIAGTRFDRAWFRYATFAVDAVCLVALVVFGPLSYASEGTVNLILGTYGALIVLLLMPLAALSLQPRLVAWTGVATVLAWWGAFLVVIVDLAWTPSWSSLPLMPSAVMLATAGLLALGLARARQIVVERAAADDARTRIRTAFGRYVPAGVIDDLVRSPASLAPTVRDATVIFVDIAGFTAASEDKSPAEAIAILDAFFRRASEVVADGGGVIVNVRGDAFLAAFNLPLEVNDYPDRALWTARALLHMVRKETFADANLALGIGIATGPVTAGAVGSARQAFNIYGDTVTRAERLQSQNKGLQSRILLDADTASGLSGETDLQKIGAVELRGREASVAIFGV